MHHTGWIQSSVDRETQVVVERGTAEDEQTFRDRVDFARIPELADVNGVWGKTVERRGHRVTVRYSASIPVERAEITVNGGTLAVSAYGPHHEIFNYHGAAERLLEHDLAALERSLEGRRLLPAIDASLSTATKRFLDSELNALVAEAAPRQSDAAGLRAPTTDYGRVLRDALMLKPAIRAFARAGVIAKVVAVILVLAALPALLTPAVFLLYITAASACFFLARRDHINAGATGPADERAKAGSPDASADRLLADAVASGMVSAAYVRRASAALAQAMPRLYGPVMLPMIVGWTVAFTFLFAFGPRMLAGWSEYWIVVILLTISGVSWIALEWLARRRLKALLGGALYPRLTRQFAASRKRYRLVGTAAFALTLLLPELF